MRKLAIYIKTLIVKNVEVSSIFKTFPEFINQKTDRPQP